MVNKEEFILRLKEIMNYYNESAATFSEKIGVQRSSISHILSGRNKPSLEFIMKILSSYKEVDLYWLLNGKGEFPKYSTDSNPAKNAENITTKAFDGNNDNSIERIVIFYKDGSFKNFQN